MSVLGYMLGPAPTHTQSIIGVIKGNIELYYTYYPSVHEWGQYLRYNLHKFSRIVSAQGIMLSMLNILPGPSRLQYHISGKLKVL